ncbi:MAG: hypothetical protein RDV48_26115 [Candidatus Eremiobacteraeota bacterium]|nr:hypothetical protein [Candidatus Eremiobacteraeota bacterium]
MTRKGSSGLSTIYFLVFGIIIGVIIVITSASLIRMKASAKSVPAPSAPSTAAGLQPASQESGAPAAGGDSKDPARVDLVECPVCKKLVNPSTDYVYSIDKKKFYFDNEICMRTFEDDPLRYADFQMKININIIRSPEEGSGSEPPSEELPSVKATNEMAPPSDTEATKQAPKAPTIEMVPTGEGPGGGKATKKPPAEPIIETLAPPPVKTKPAPPPKAPPKATGAPQELQIEEIPLE